MKGAEQESAAVQEIKAHPVEVRQGVVEHRGQVGGVREPMPLAGIQRAQLLLEFAVGVGFRETRRAANDLHRRKRIG